jgi:hypothetical protein
VKTTSWAERREKDTKAAAVRKLEQELKDEKQAEIARYGCLPSSSVHTPILSRRKEITLERRRAAEERRSADELKAKVRTTHNTLQRAHVSAGGRKKGRPSEEEGRPDKENPPLGFLALPCTHIPSMHMPLLPQARPSLAQCQTASLLSITAFLEVFRKLARCSCLFLVS